jgi:hypothetical protein
MNKTRAPSRVRLAYCLTYLTYVPLINLLVALKETRDSSLVMLTYLPYLLTSPHLRACKQPSGRPKKN